jgi:stage II sporulation protein P
MRNNKAGDVLKKLKGLKNALCIVIALFLVGLGGVCVITGIFQYDKNTEGAVMMAAALTMSKGSYNITPPETVAETQKQVVKETKPTEETMPVTSDFDNSYYNTFAKHNNVKKYPVYTKQYITGGEKYDNFYVKNSTSYDLNIGETIKNKLGFKMENNKKVQVLIYHTHTCESYLDRDVGYYYSDYYPRTDDNRYNVTKVGEVLAQELEKAGIGVVHDKTIHDYSYSGSYDRSRKTVEKNLEKYPDIRVTIDIHRDSIGDDTYKVKPTFTHKGKKGAQIMIMTGYDPTGYYDFPDWNYNLRFALQLQQADSQVHVPNCRHSDREGV